LLAVEVQGAVQQAVVVERVVYVLAFLQQEAEVLLNQQ
jgi:hypothetical protein